MATGASPLIDIFVYRSCPKVFCKRNVLKIFEKFPGKHLGRSLFLNKIAGRMSVTLLKRGLVADVFL